MATSNKNVVFDCVGTLVGYEKLNDYIDMRLGVRLRAHCVNPALFGYTWIEVTEREYTYISMSGKYLAFAELFEALFWRVLAKAEIPHPRNFANKEDLAYIMTGFKALELRRSAGECIEKLRDAGFTVWGFTMGDTARVGDYFKNGGVHLPAENLLSCDSSRIGKPDPAAYRPLFEQLNTPGKPPWFAAAHMWDVSADKRSVGYKGAYCSIYEMEALPDIFGELDVMADTLPEMAEKIIAATK